MIGFKTLGIEGGHTVTVVGYDDRLKIRNRFGGDVTKGALLISDSGGKNWGEDRYGWLPYEYILRGPV